ALFEPRLIEAIYLVDEYAFDTTRLAEWARRELQRCGVRVVPATRATGIVNGAGNSLRVRIRTAQGADEHVSCRYAFNCTYSGLNQLGGDFPGTRTAL